MDQTYTNQPRIYVDADLKAGQSIALPAGPVHYFRSVLRRQAGDVFRVFNGHDGEWLATLEELSKKNGSAVIKEQLRPQPESAIPLHLIFAPLKKNRMDMVIEKAVELGVSAFHPVLTHHTEVRKLNTERLTAQITEAAEQCERLDIPALHDLAPLETALRAPGLNDVPIYGCIERGDHPSLNNALTPGPAAFIIGPVGGFSQEESNWLSGLEHIRAVSLGETILRAETASIFCLSAHKLKNT